MQILERINAGGTTVLMATHEAGIVDKMQRRVIELVDGVIVRDEREGGYGTTGVVPELKPAVAKGQSAKAAREEVREATAEAEAETKAHQILISTPDAGASAPVPTRAAALKDNTDTEVPSNATGAISLPRPEATSDLTEHLSLAERLGLRGTVDPETGDEQNVGPVK